jgi:hypothetical protein
VHCKSLQFREAVALKNKPTIYLVIRSGVFECLPSASTVPTAKEAFSVMDVLQAETNPVAGECDSIDSHNHLHITPVCPKCVQIFMTSPVAYIVCLLIVI